MSLRDDIIDAVEDRLSKQNPWIRYRGDAGGEGWQHVLTGEVRYQDKQPEPSDGMPEGYSQEDIPELDQEGPDELSQLPTEDNLQEYLEEGMEVTADLDIGEIHGEIVHMGNKGLVVEQNGEEYSLNYSEIEEHPVELEPGDGWAEGWVAPDDDLKSFDMWDGRNVEFYDLDTGEYVQASYKDSQSTNWLTVEDAEGEEHHIDLTGGSDTNNILTAVEDPLNTVEADTLMSLTDKDLLELNEGDTIIVENLENPYGRGVVTHPPTSTTVGDVNGVKVKFQSESGNYFDLNSAATSYPENREIFRPLNEEMGVPAEYIEDIDPETIEDLNPGDDIAVTFDHSDEDLGLDVGVVDHSSEPTKTYTGAVTADNNVYFPSLEEEFTPEELHEYAEETYAAVGELKQMGEIPGFDTVPWLVDGQFTTFDHPIHGEIEGDVEIYTDPEGYEWFRVDPPDVDAEQLSEGDEISLENADGTFEYRGELDRETYVEDTDMEPEDIASEEIEGKHILLSDDGQTYLETEDNMQQPGEMVLTSNPEHPLHYEGHATVKNPWTTTEEFEEANKDWDDDLKYGSKVLLDDGSIVTVAQYDELSVEDPDGGEYRVIEDVDGEYHTLDEVDSVVNINTNRMGAGPLDTDWQSEPLGREYWEGDELLFEGSDGYEVYQVQEQDDDRVELEPVDGDGESRELPREEVDDEAIGFAGEGVRPLPEGDDLHYFDDGEYVTVAYKDNSDELQHVTGMFIEPAGHGDPKVVDFDGVETRIPDEHNAVVTEEPQIPEEYRGADERESDEIAADIASKTNAARKEGHALRHEIYPELLEHFNASDAAMMKKSLTDSPEGWKSTSNSRTANKWEKTFADALGIEAKTLGNRAISGDGTRIAKTLNEMSQLRWENEPENENWHRGLAKEGGAALLSEYLSDPFGEENDELPVPTRAVANYTTQRHTAENLGDGYETIVVTQERGNIPSEAVVSYHDDFFESGNSGENEVSMRGDKMTVPYDGVYIDSSQKRLSDNPKEMPEEAFREFFRKVSDQYGKIFYEQNNVGDEPTQNQLENYIRLTEIAKKKHGIPETELARIEDVKQKLEQEYGVDASDVGFRGIENAGVAEFTDPPEFATRPQDFETGMEVTFLDHGEQMPGEITDAEEGILTVQNVDTGEEMAVEPNEIEEIVYSSTKYGPPSEVDMTDYETTDFGKGDQVLVWSGGTWDEGIVVEGGDENVEVSADGMSDYFTDDLVQDNWVVPVDEVHMPEEDGDGSSGESEGSNGVDWEGTAEEMEFDEGESPGSELVDSITGDFEQGDLYETASGIHTIAEVNDDGEITVRDEYGNEMVYSNPSEDNVVGHSYKKTTDAPGDGLTPGDKFRVGAGDAKQTSTIVQTNGSPESSVQTIYAVSEDGRMGRITANQVEEVEDFSDMPADAPLDNIPDDLLEGYDAENPIAVLEYPNGDVQPARLEPDGEGGVEPLISVMGSEDVTVETVVDNDEPAPNFAEGYEADTEPLSQGQYTSILTNDGEVLEMIVENPPVAPAEPAMLVDEETGEDYMLWPHGELESV